MIILKGYLLNKKKTNISAKCEDVTWINFIINFPRIVTSSMQNRSLDICGIWQRLWQQIAFMVSYMSFELQY